MQSDDYKKLGFRAGLEIHQQLDTRKLFCNCPGILRTDEPEFVIHRKLHAVAGESGVIDEAAKYEAAIGRDFFYQGYSTTCLVELDEEPPHELNPDALKIALQLSELFNCQALPIVQVMRKTVIDGSNTSGFQRTVLIAINGFLETSKGKVGIQSICLEEDAARIVEKTEKSSIYRLDRLGIPLIEIATDPDLKDAEHVKETALKLGEILRSCKVKRGIGTIRQDVNVSIKGGARIEIKGFQEPSMMIKIVDNEILRQKELVEQGKKVNSEVRNALPDGRTEFMRPMPGADRMYPETDIPLLKISRDMLNEAKKNLPKLKSEIESELKDKGLEPEMMKLLLSEGLLEEFKALINLHNHPNLVVKTLVLWPKEIAARNNL
ncbi:Glu-tRNA(Gln) amidotransferase subunit GatE, partial [Candidatus Pacearchaeota archaeon]|nr:Glu-tRNA(Gln) amidotransferase subunit GatE [Candidatus Pacearchaeota archaeon]